MQLIVLNAGRLKEVQRCDPHGNNDSTEFLLAQQWCKDNMPNCVVPDNQLFDPAGFIGKISFNICYFLNGGVNIAEYNKYVHQVVFMFRRKGLNYIERINIGTDSWMKRYERILPVWRRLARWLEADEIEDEHDIVIYRTQWSQQRLPNIGGASMRKYPIRLNDDTYCIMAGQVEWLRILAEEIYDQTGIVDQLVPFASWFEDAVYDYYSEDPNRPARDKKFHKESPLIRRRSHYIWSWFTTKDYDLESCFERRSMEPFADTRTDMLLWKDGNVKVWHRILTGQQLEADNFSLCAYENNIMSSLRLSSYDWSIDDEVFIQR
jgi:hypothetical protein